MTVQRGRSQRVPDNRNSVGSSSSPIDLTRSSTFSRGRTSAFSLVSNSFNSIAEETMEENAFPEKEAAEPSQTASRPGHCKKKIQISDARLSNSNTAILPPSLGTGTTRQHNPLHKTQPRHVYLYKYICFRTYDNTYKFACTARVCLARAIRNQTNLIDIIIFITKYMNININK